MRKLVYLFFLIFLMIIVVPILILKSCQISSSPKDAEKAGKVKMVSVYIKEQDKVIQMELDEYIKGVVAAEMPANFELEALKAQAVAARTYTLLKIIKPSPELKEAHKGADICTNYAHCQAWKSKDQLKETWGFFGYYKYWSKISRAVNETKNQVMTYQGEIINPLFHSTSGGKTENSEDVFSSKLPYLRSVISLGEEASPKFTSKTVVGFDEFKNKLTTLAADIILSKKDVGSAKITEVSEGGRVKQIQIGNKSFAGRDLRNIFSLNSTNFKIGLEKDNVVFTTIGYGHGVGMSQFGANYLAGQGKNYKEILKHYYQGIDIIDLQNQSK